MKASELKELTIKELEEKIENEQNLLVKQKLNHTVSPLDNPMKIKEATEYCPIDDRFAGKTIIRNK